MKKIVVVCLLSLFVLAGCSSNSSVVQDTKTSSKPEILSNVDSKHMIIEYKYDNMVRDTFYYHMNESGKTVIDTEYYKTQPISRGEVVYFKPLPSKRIPNTDDQLARIIGLPGEKVKITKGQVYINGAKLDAFYGQATQLGMNQTEYVEFQKKKDSNYTLDEDSKKFFNQDIPEVTLANDQVFVLGDTWWRSNDSMVFGPLPKQQIIGIAIGVTGK